MYAFHFQQYALLVDSGSSSNSNPAGLQRAINSCGQSVRNQLNPLLSTSHYPMYHAHREVQNIKSDANRLGYAANRYAHPRLQHNQ